MLYLDNLFDTSENDLMIMMYFLSNFNMPSRHHRIIRISMMNHTCIFLHTDTEDPRYNDSVCSLTV